VIRAKAWLGNFSQQLASLENEPDYFLSPPADLSYELADSVRKWSTLFAKAGQRDRKAAYFSNKPAGLARRRACFYAQ